MAFRFRKAFNFGGVRINLSKSGIGYSIGCGGFRVSKTARNTIRTTATISGTGISNTTETSLNKKIPNNSVNQNDNCSTIFYDKKVIENDIDALACSEGLNEIVKQARFTIIFNKILNYLLIFTGIFSFGVFNYVFIPLFIIFLILKMYAKFKMKIGLNYSISSELKDELVNRFEPIIKGTLSQTCKAVNNVLSVKDKKYAAGAQGAVSYDTCIISTKVPFPFSSESVIATVQTKNKEWFIFMPDALFYMKRSKVKAFSYDDLKCDYKLTNIAETSAVPSDAKVIAKTWRYVNSDNTPDKRFKDNYQIPICQYGEYSITSPLGLDLVLLFSRG